MARRTVQWHLHISTPINFTKDEMTADRRPPRRVALATAWAIIEADTTAPQTRALIALALRCGLAPPDLALLMGDDWDQTTSLLAVRHGPQVGVWQLDDESADLMPSVGSGEPLWTNRKGSTTAASIEQIQDAVEAAASACGYAVTTLEYVRTAAVGMATDGIPLAKIRQLLPAVDGDNR